MGKIAQWDEIFNAMEEFESFLALMSFFSEDEKDDVAYIGGDVRGRGKNGVIRNFSEAEDVFYKAMPRHFSEINEEVAFEKALSRRFVKTYEENQSEIMGRLFGNAKAGKVSDSVFEEAKRRVFGNAFEDESIRNLTKADESKIFGDILENAMTTHLIAADRGSAERHFDNLTNDELKQRLEMMKNAGEDIGERENVLKSFLERDLFFEDGSKEHDFSESSAEKSEIERLLAGYSLFGVDGLEKRELEKELYLTNANDLSGGFLKKFMISNDERDSRLSKSKMTAVIEAGRDGDVNNSIQNVKIEVVKNQKESADFDIDTISDLLTDRIKEIMSISAEGLYI